MYACLYSVCNMLKFCIVNCTKIYAYFVEAYNTCEFWSKIIDTESISQVNCTNTGMDTALIDVSWYVTGMYTVNSIAWLVCNQHLKCVCYMSI